jgi:hypothetical protein
METHPDPAAVGSAASLSAWTPDRVARAARLYIAEGMSAAEIADALGPSFSRSAVCGKLRRLGLAKREARPLAEAGDRARVVRLAPPSRTRIEQRLPPRRPPMPLPPLREPEATGVPALLADLQDGQCRWPIDDPGPGQMHRALFCAGPADGHAYCAAHRWVASARNAGRAA